MKRTMFILLGSMLTAAALSAGTGCGDSGSTGGGGSGGDGSGTTTTTTTTTTSTTTTTTTTAGPSLDCTSYCTEVMANCTGADAQYGNMDACMGACAAFPVGTIDDKSGDTLGCRLYHGGAPAMMAPATHCPHAGPTGGDKDPTDASGGTCGEACESFCNIALKTCSAQYADMTTCMNDCKTFAPDAADYSTADTSKNDYGCRMYHLSVAASGAAAAATHCPHIVSSSPVCTM